jgi:cytochrome c peroxidase
MEHFGELVAEVMEGRMNGPRLGAEYIDSLAHWIDAQPALERSRFDEEASARGEALFHSNETGCGTCHTGPMFTNDLTVDVGTGLPLQVPSLLGVSFRAPYMHDGCAPNLNARFGACGGGDLHGRTSQLTDGDVADLVAYMKTL